MPAEVSPTQELTAQLYDELCAMAHRIMRHERDEHTLRTTPLVHEAFLRLARQHATEWRDRSYFLAAAAQTMRRVLVDYARERSARKRDGGEAVTLVSGAIINPSVTDALDVVVLEDTLSRLALLDERQARVVELRVFGGFDIAETAEIIGVSVATVNRDWRFACAWLACELSPPE
ncbi:MAG TPA: ECF-type sigma factor [Gemmatimonadales bacterium]